MRNIKLHWLKMNPSTVPVIWFYYSINLFIFRDKFRVGDLSPKVLIIFKSQITQIIMLIFCARHSEY